MMIVSSLQLQWLLQRCWLQQQAARTGLQEADWPGGQQRLQEVKRTAGWAWAEQLG